MVMNIQSYWNPAIDFYFFMISLRDLQLIFKIKIKIMGTGG
jgi:hypothetical protein